MKTLGITILSVIIFTVVAGIVTVAWRQLAPSYTCSAILEVSPPERSSLEPAPASLPKPELEALAARYASLAASEPVLQSALASPEVRKTVWLQDSPDTALKRLADGLTILPVPGSALIRVSMTGTDKGELPDIVNAVASAAVERSCEIANRGKQDQIRQLRQERTSLADTRDRLRAQKAKLLRDAQTPDLMDPNGGLIMRLRGLAQAVSSAELELAGAEASIQRIRQMITKGEASSLPQVVQFVERDPVVCGLLTRRAEIAAGLEPREPAATSQPGGKETLAALDGQIAARKQDLAATFAKSVLAEAETRRDETLIRLTELRQQYRLADVNLRDVRATLGAYTQLDEMDKTLTGQIERIDSRLSDLRILLQGGQPLQVLQLAGTPLEPSFPKWRVMLPAGAGVGLILGLLTCLVLSLARRRKAGVEAPTQG